MLSEFLSKIKKYLVQLTNKRAFINPEGRRGVALYALIAAEKKAERRLRKFLVRTERENSERHLWKAGEPMHRLQWWSSKCTALGPFFATGKNVQLCQQREKRKPTRPVIKSTQLVLSIVRALPLARYLCRAEDCTSAKPEVA